MATVGKSGHREKLQQTAGMSPLYQFLAMQLTTVFALATRTFAT